MTEKSKKMIAFIYKKHGDKLDKCRDPYFLHPFAVSKLICQHVEDASLDLIMAGLGHDLKEDTNATDREMLDVGFSKRSIELINAVSKNLYPSGTTYFDVIQALVDNRDTEAMHLKLYDNAHNLDPTRISRIKEYRNELEKRYKKSSSLLVLGLENAGINVELPEYMVRT